MYGLVSRTTGVCGCPMCLSLSQYYAASIIITLQYNLKSGIVTFPEDLFFLFFSNVLPIIFFYFWIKFNNNSIISKFLCKEMCWGFYRVSLNLQITFMAIFKY